MGHRYGDVHRMPRLRRSLEVLRDLNVARSQWHSVPGCGCGCDVVRLAEQRLAQHDADCRARVDPRQTTIYDRIHVTSASRINLAYERKR
jgi:hypothetical protein